MSQDVSSDKFTSCFTEALKCPDIQNILRNITRPTQQELRDMLCDELQHQLQPLRDAIKKKGGEIAELKRKVVELRSEMDRFERHGRRGCDHCPGNNTNAAFDDNDDALFTVYPKKYAHGFCFAGLCCGYTLTDFPISIRLTSLALWQSNDCPSASKATLMNMDKYFMWIHYERLHNHNKAKHNKTVCIFLGIYCTLDSKALEETLTKGKSTFDAGIKTNFAVVDISFCLTLYCPRNPLRYQTRKWWACTKGSRLMTDYATGPCPKHHDQSLSSLPYQYVVMSQNQSGIDQILPCRYAIMCQNWVYMPTWFDMSITLK